MHGLKQVTCYECELADCCLCFSLYLLVLLLDENSPIVSMIITYTVNKDYFHTTTILIFLAAKITNKQIGFAGSDNTKDGDGPRQVYQGIYVFPRWVEFNDFTFAI
jgi:hypothetical protein